MKRLKKRALFIFATCFILVSTFFYFLPRLLSSQMGKKALISYLERQTKTKISIDNLSLSWFNGQKIDKVSIEQEGLFECTFSLLETECPLWHLIKRQGTTGKTTLLKPTLSFTQIPRDQGEKGGIFWRDFEGVFILTEGNFTLDRSLTLNLPSLEVSILPSSQTYSMKGEGTTTFGSQVGTLEVDLLKEDEKVKGKGELKAFPVDVINTLYAPFLSPLSRLAIESFGETIDLNLTAEPRALGTSIMADLRSPYISTTISCTYDNKVLTLDKSARLEWTLTPQIINQLNNHVSLPLKMLEPTLLICDLKSARIDKEALTDHKPFESQGTLTLAPVILALNETPLTLNLLSMDFRTTEEAEKVSISLSSEGTYASLSKTLLQASGALGGVWKKEIDVTDLDVQIQHAPLPLIDQLKVLDIELTPLLGTTFDIEAKWLTPNRLHLSLATPLATLEKAVFSFDSMLELIQEPRFSYRIPKELSNHLATPIALSGQVKELSIPIDKGKLEWKRGLLALNVTAAPFTVKDAFSLGALTSTQTSCMIQSQSPGISQFDYSSQYAFANGSKGYTLVGSNVTAAVKGELNWRSLFEVDPLHIKLTSPTFQAVLDAYIKSNTLNLAKDSHIAFRLPPSLVNPILQEKSTDLTLAEAAPIDFTLTAATLPLTPSKEAFWELKGKGASSSLSLVTKRTGYSFTLDDVMCLFSGNAKQHTLKVEAHARKKGSSMGHIAFNWANGTSPTWQLNLTEFSSSFADAVLKDSAYFSPIIGSTFDLNLDFASNPTQDRLTLDLDSSALQLAGSFLVKDQILTTINKPLSLNWKMTNQGFYALKNLRSSNQSPPQFTLEGVAGIDAQISNLSLPLKKQEGSYPEIDWNLYRATFNTAIEINNLTLKSIESPLQATLDELDLKLQKKGVGAALSCDLAATLTHSKREKGSIRGKTYLEDMWTPTGELNSQKLTASVRGAFETVPTLFIDLFSELFFATSPNSALFLGDAVSANLNVDIKESKGTIEADLAATHCQTHFLGAVNQGTITLLRPLQATLRVTPQLNALLAKTAHIEVVSTSKPITLSIDQKGFSASLTHLSLQKTRLSYGRLDLDQVVCRNVGSASDLNELFKLNPFDSSLSSFWFAPMEFQITNGVMFIDRTEILYNQSYQVALWGNIDYNKRFVSMFLGLTAQSLRAALGIRNLSSNYVLAIPIRGPFGDVKLDKAAASSKIAFLIARKQIAPRAGAWGSLFGAIGDLADDQSNIPPAKPPFPWQK